MIRKVLIMIMLLGMIPIFHPTNSVVAQNVACDGAPPSRLYIGARAAIIPVQEGVEAAKVRVRQQPGLKGVVVTQLQTGAQMTIADGPQCADGYLWWVIQLDDGLKGWAAEGSKQNYFLDPIKAALINCPGTPPTRFVIGARGQVRPAKAGATPNVARIRDDASASGKILLNLPEQTSFTVLAGPECQENYVWWKVQVDNNATGWVAEGDVTRGYYIIPTGYTRAALNNTTPTPGAPPTPGKSVPEVLGFWRAALSPDDHFVAGILTNFKIKVWDAATGQLYWAFQPDIATASLLFSPDGKTLLLGDKDGNVLLYDLGKKEQSKRFELSSQPSNPTVDMLFSPDGKLLAVDHGFGNVQVVTAADGKLVQEVDAGPRQTIAGMGFSPDSTLLVTGGSDSTPVIWNIQTGEKVRSLTGHTDLICGLAWSTDGKFIVSGSLDTSIKVWDAATGQTIRTFAGTTPPSTTVTLSISRDDKRVVVAHNDSITRVWDIATGQEKVQFIGQFTHVIAADFNSNGKQVLTAGKDGTARLWDAEAGREIRRFLAKD